MRTALTAAALAVALFAPPAHAAPAHRGPQSGTAVVTAYCSDCSGSTGCRGQRLRVGDVAADPRYHPYGSRVRIDGFGVLTVRDVGGAIKGAHRFDVYRGVFAECQCGQKVGKQRRHWEVAE